MRIHFLSKVLGEYMLTGKDETSKITEREYIRAKSYCEKLDSPEKCSAASKQVTSEVDEDFSCRWGQKIKKILGGKIMAVPARAFWKDGCYIWIAENSTLKQ